MLNSVQTTAPKPAALPPAAQAALPANTAGVPSFAQFLSDEATPMPTPPAQADGESGDSEADQPTASAPAPATTRRATQTAAKPASATPNRAAEAAAPKAGAKAATDPVEAKDAGDAVDAADEDDAPETPELTEFTQLIGMAQPGAPALPAQERKSDAPVKQEAATIVTDAKDRAAARTSAADAAAADTPQTAPAKPGDLRADKAAARAASEPLTTAQSQDASEKPGTAPTTPNFAAALAQALPTPTAVAGATPTAPTAVQAPLRSNAFAPELGARVSLLAVDGVQQAELQLNPTDMGPVRVQIVVDGGQAQVSFHAAQAETRQALEQSLPDLAAALQGQGLTLSGGGVFQQAQRDADHEAASDNTPDSDRSSRRGGERLGAAAGTAASPARRTVGLVDTFA